MKIGIGNLRIDSSGLSYFSIRNFRTTGRSGLTLIDEFGNNASIIPSCGLCDGNNYLTRDVSSFNAIASGYIEVRCYYTGSGTYKWLFVSADLATDLHIFNCYLGNGIPKIQVLSTGVSNVYAATNALSTGWHIIKFESIASKYRITVDGSIVAGAMSSGIDNGKWTSAVLNRDNITIGWIKRLTPNYTSLVYIDYVDYNGSYKWYLTGQGITEYEVNGGSSHLTWTGTSHVFYGNNISNQCLDVGYSLYTKEGSVNEYIPYKSVGVPCDNISVMEAVGYIHWGDIAGDADNYNVTPALIEFPSTIVDYDRSNTTIHKATARTGSDYDAANPFRWRGIDVSNPDVYYSWKNTGYENKQFAKIDFILAHTTKVYEFLSFKTNLSTSNKSAAERYCNIDDYYLVDIILMGDKTDGVNMTNNAIMNAIYVAQTPDVIIGVGDYDDLAHTTTELMTGITGLIKFASPGNHDDWVVGTRTEFNANFHGSGVAYHGSYKKISLPNIDFFLYDQFLKTDESGYYTYTQANAITLAARQASTQGAWLIAQLAASTAKFKVVVFHNPAWASDTSDPLAVYTYNQMRWDWQALGADLILNGMFHFYERLLKDTGGGDIPIINLGTSGAGQIEWGDIEPDSIVRYNSFTDSDFSAGMLIKMTVNRNILQIDLSGISTDSVIHSGKDQLILTK